MQRALANKLPLGILKNSVACLFLTLWINIVDVIARIGTTASFNMCS